MELLNLNLIRYSKSGVSLNIDPNDSSELIKNMTRAPKLKGWFNAVQRNISKDRDRISVQNLRNSLTVLSNKLQNENFRQNITIKDELLLRCELEKIKQDEILGLNAYLGQSEARSIADKEMLSQIEVQLDSLSSNSQAIKQLIILDVANIESKYKKIIFKATFAGTEFLGVAKEMKAKIVQIKTERQQVIQQKHKLQNKLQEIYHNIIKDCIKFKRLPDKKILLGAQKNNLSWPNLEGKDYFSDTLYYLHRQEFNQAIKCIENAIASGDFSAKTILGAYYQKGLGVKIDEKLAFRLFNEALQAGDSSAKAYLGFCYSKGIAVAPDKEKAFEYFKEAAESKDPNGLINLGYCYANGIGTVVNEQKAFDCYRQAANLGYALAITDLGCCYTIGFGVEKNETIAFKLFQDAALLGDTYAMNELAKGNYKESPGKNVKEAFEWFQLAAKFGHMGAMNNFAICYRDGIGVKANLLKAYKYFAKVAEAGLGVGMTNLGNLYQEDGNIRKAREWYVRAAKVYNEKKDGLNLENLIRSAYCEDILKEFSIPYNSLSKEQQQNHPTDIITLDSLGNEDKVFALTDEKGTINCIIQESAFFNWIMQQKATNNGIATNLRVLQVPLLFYRV